MTTTTGRSFETAIGFSEEARGALAQLVNARLADTADLHSQLKQAHWNVKGPRFQTLHQLFDQVAEAVEPFIDQLAERVTTLGRVAHGTVRMAAQASRLSEYPEDLVGGEQHLQAVRDLLGGYAQANRADIERSGELGDPVSQDLLIEIGRAVELQLYFVESHLQGQGS